MTYNLPALKKLYQSIQQENHDQSVWGKFSGRPDALEDGPAQWNYGYGVSCPTAACAAGWTVVNEGAKMLFDRHGLEMWGYVQSASCITADGEYRTISDYAQEILGLSYREVTALFDGSTSTEQVLSYLGELMAAAQHNMSWEEFRAKTGKPWVGEWA
jgi:hypothetical protein